MKTWLFVAVLCMSFGCGVGTPMQGEKIGTITRVARGGVLCDTWEATIIRGGMSNGSGAFSAPYDFTIESQDLADAAQKYMEAQKEVKLRYRAEGIYSLCRSNSSGHFAVAIDPIMAPSSDPEGR